MPGPMHLFSGSSVSQNRGCEQTSWSELQRVTVDRGYAPSIICPSSFLRCEHEQSPFNIGDLGFERQPVGPGKYNDSKSCAGADHPAASDRIDTSQFTDYHLSADQSARS